MNGRLILIVTALIVLAAGTALILSARAPTVPDETVPPGAAVTAPHEATGAIDPALVPLVEAAKAASADAIAQAEAADRIAAEADRVAAEASRYAQDGKEAAEKARAAAKTACKAPGRTQGCAEAPDGTRYEGVQTCRAEGCGPDGHGVFTDKRRGWESQGLWEDWSMVVGCDTMKGKVTYCGQQAASAWSGFGISYNEKAAAISALWRKGVGQNPILLDYPTGSRMRGEMASYELDGLGVYDRADGRVLRGRWQKGALVTGVVAYPVSGDRVSGAFAEGNARSGTIAYRDGSLFAGEIEDSSSLAQARPARGVLYRPDGSIAHQGTWQAGMPVPN